MSKENIKLFFAELEKNAALKAEYAAAMQKARQQVDMKLAEKLIVLGSSVGFSFTASDIDAARIELIDQFNGNRELTDDDLLQAAGGQRNSPPKSPVYSVITCPTRQSITQPQPDMPPSPLGPTCIIQR